MLDFLNKKSLLSIYKLYSILISKIIEKPNVYNFLKILCLRMFTSQDYQLKFK